MTKKQAIYLAKQIINEYPDAKCSLNFENPFQLLIAVSLSAQCTDERVNSVTPNLFSKYPTPKDLANANLSDVEKIIHSCGFYKNKSKNIVNAGKSIISDFNGEIPNDLEKLQSIPGVGRKTANVIMHEAFNDPKGIAVDTHVGRISTRLGISNNKTPEKIESDLTSKIPRELWQKLNHAFIYHGRAVCTSQSPKCENCVVKNECKYYKNIKKQ